ncbi:MAG: guanylate kinase [Prevotellaceae bacterium]|jgi:guanylate kinase|nr:guanylate kinase [Prevotellaceae bacterium]
MNKVIIFSAPSGAGKSTVVRHLLEKFPQLEFSISATSRQPRGIELHEIDYHFLTVDEFKQKIAGNEFVEWEEVYAGNYYGTLKSEVKRIWAKGNVILFDVDVKGGINIKEIYGDTALSVFIMPPSIDILRKRLQERGTDLPEAIERRVHKAEEEITYVSRFDVILLNDKLEDTLHNAEKIVSDFIDM